MRKTVLTMALTLIVVFATTTDAFAQRRGFGGGRGGGGYGYGNGYYGNGYGSGYYGNGYGNGNYGNGFYGNGYYGGLNSQGYYGSGYSSPYNGSSYYGQPAYDQSAFQVPQTNVYQSSYEPSQSQQAAKVMVMVPQQDATVWFNGAATTQQGIERSFYSPPLEGNGPFSYTIRARWMENGKSVERERRINVQPGQSVSVDFRSDLGAK